MIQSGNDKMEAKLIVIKGDDEVKIKEALRSFCGMYNEDSQRVMLKVHSRGNNLVIVTFPDDIDFDIFCYLVNYIKYPIDISYVVEVIGWTIVGRIEFELTAEIVGKRTIVFVDPEDDEYDNVMLTTADNEAYKLRFSVSGGLRKMDNRILDYRDHNMILGELKSLSSVLIK